MQNLDGSSRDEEREREKERENHSQRKTIIE